MGLWGLNIVWAGTFGGFLNVLLRTGGSTSKVRIKCNTQTDCQSSTAHFFLLTGGVNWPFTPGVPLGALMGQNCFAQGPSNFLDILTSTLENVLVSVDQNQTARAIYVLPEEVPCLDFSMSANFVNASKPEPSLSVNGMPAKKLKFWDSPKFQTENRWLQNGG